MIRTQLYLPDDLFAQAKAVAVLRNMNISQLMRLGLAKEINGFAAPAKKSPKKANKRKKTYDPLGHLVGKFTFGDGSPTNVALNHNDIYDL